MSKQMVRIFCTPKLCLNKASSTDSMRKVGARIQCYLMRKVLGLFPGTSTANLHVQVNLCLQKFNACYLIFTYNINFHTYSFGIRCFHSAEKENRTLGVLSGLSIELPAIQCLSHTDTHTHACTHNTHTQWVCTLTSKSYKCFIYFDYQRE